MSLVSFNSSLISSWFPYGIVPTYSPPPFVNCNELSCLETLSQSEKNTFQIFSSHFPNPLESFEKTREMFDLKNDDHRDKFLYLSIENDSENDFTPEKISDLSSDLIKNISSHYDFKYKAVKAHEICKEVFEASTMGKLANVILYEADESILTAESLDLLKCFQGLHPSGKIILMPRAQSSLLENTIQKVSTATKRDVIAPLGNLASGMTRMVRAVPFEIFQKYSSFWPWLNTYKTFRPIYEKCTGNPTNLHDRERLVNAAVNSFFSTPPVSHSPFELCEDDPKNKFLFLSFEKDHNSAFHPGLMVKLFKDIADHYDLKYKVIRSFYDICREVSEASKKGNLTEIVIQGHGKPEGICFSSWDCIDKEYDFAECFEGLDPAGKITLFSCETGKSIKETNRENIATVIAKKTNKEVVAPEGSPKSLFQRISSLEPFQAFYPSEHNPTKNMFKSFHFKKENSNTHSFPFAALLGASVITAGIAYLSKFRFHKRNFPSR